VTDRLVSVSAYRGDAEWQLVVHGG